MKAALPPDEIERLKSLRSYDILDTTPEEEYDDLTLLASYICQTPIAMISLVDEKRQWFKSKIGHGITETSRDIAMCAHGILQSEVLVIKDTRNDARFADNPLVTEAPKMRFYAGAPLTTPDGHRLGMLCVSDHEPRELKPEQIQALEALSRQVMTQLELRRSTEELSNTIIKLHRMKAQLASRNAILEAMADDSFHGLLVVDRESRKVLQNRRMVELWKIPKHIAEDEDDQQQIVWVTGRTKKPEEFVERVSYLYTHPEEKGHDEIELRDGTILDRYSSPVVGQDGTYYGRLWAFHDITERKAIDARLFQSQKLETVGKLAGGVAHEFNSMLTAIIGHSELLLAGLPRQDSNRQNVEEIRLAANRAATLTQQLLAYGRKQMLRPETLNLNEVLGAMEGTLRHLAGSNVEVRFEPGKNLDSVRIDPGQMEQVIVNLVMNALEAMPNGGRILIETANTNLDETYTRTVPGLKPGSYVMLALSDTGVGMTSEIKSRLFEPFYSTKGVGHGTGLGLPACYGILKQSEGHISVNSEPGCGSTFRIYLPQVKRPAKNTAEPAARDLPRGTETILLAENDPSLLEMSALLLRRLGYTVHTATDGIEALMVKHQQETGRVDLIFTDVVMSNLNGKESADRIRNIFPHTKILLTSVDPENISAWKGQDNGVALLSKPYTPSTLARQVRDILDHKSA